jgi:integrase/recombinase XerD
MNLEVLFENFVREKRFLNNVTDKTVTWYYQSWKAFKRTVGTEKLDKATITEFMVKLRSTGISATSCNVYARAINSFLSWLYENEHTPEHYRIKKAKEEKKVIQTYSETHLKAFLSWKPKTWYDYRLYALLCALIDTGARINELLSLRREKIDFDNCLITLSGKGNKERIVPMSLELRKVLFRWLQKNEHQLVFPTRDGMKINYRHALRYFNNLCKGLGITEVQTSFHIFRHTFAINYIRQGGNVLYLQRLWATPTLL